MSSENGDPALQDVTNSLANTHMDHDAAQRARDHGWSEQHKFDYEALKAKPNDKDGSATGPVWAANAKKYEWDDDYGDVGPVHEQLELELFGKEHVVKKGQDYERYALIFESCQP